MEHAELVLSRRMVYTLLIVVAAAAGAGRILAAALQFDPANFRDPSLSEEGRKPWPSRRPAATPMFGSNDRSRWATVRALVDEGTFVIGRRQPGHPDAQNDYGDHGIVFEDGWESVDKVLHPERQAFYSSKPPLLPTLAAGEYWLLKHLFGFSITERRFTVVRLILFTVNWLPWIVYLFLLARLIEDYGATDWGRLFVLAAACFGTLLTPFLVAFNNHSVATYCTLFALYPALRIYESSAKAGDAAAATQQLGHFLLAGFFTGCTVAMELPAASFAAALGAFLLYLAPRRALTCFLPAAMLPLLALLVLNYLAIGEVMPAYEKLQTPWYQYPGSHWHDPSRAKRGIDFLRESKASYAFHFLFGHHGLFALTPIFLFSLAGMVCGVRPSVSPEPRKHLVPAVLHVLTAYLFVVVVGFYLWKTNNYGGGTCGPRWLMWLTPLLLLTMLPAVDWLGRRRWGRGLAYFCLGIAVLSAAYPALNPWRHPWIAVLMESQGWLRF